MTQIENSSQSEKSTLVVSRGWDGLSLWHLFHVLFISWLRPTTISPHKTPLFTVIMLLSSRSQPVDIQHTHHTTSTVPTDYHPYMTKPSQCTHLFYNLLLFCFITI